MDQKTSDLRALTEAAKDLLTGRFTVGLKVLDLRGPIKREGRNPEWMARAVAGALEENQELIPAMVSMLSESVAERLIQAVRRRYPE